MPIDPDEQWLQDMSATYARNAKYAVSRNSYNSQLSPGDETKFRQWVDQNRVPFNANDPIQDYDMRGYWRDIAHQGQNETGVNKNDGELHYPDTYKTPYHHSFSSESMYARPNAPAWINDHQLADPATGDVLWDEQYMGQQAPITTRQLPPAKRR